MLSWIAFVALASSADSWLASTDPSPKNTIKHTADPAVVKLPSSTQLQAFPVRVASMWKGSNCVEQQTHKFTKCLDTVMQQMKACWESKISAQVATNIWNIRITQLARSAKVWLLPPLPFRPTPSSCWHASRGCGRLVTKWLPKMKGFDRPQLNRTNYVRDLHFIGGFGFSPFKKRSHPPWPTAKNMRPLRILLQAFGQLPGRTPKNPPLPELKGKLKGKTFMRSLVSSWFSFKTVDSWFLVLFICYFHGQCPHTLSPAMDLFSARACYSCNLGVEESVVWRVSTRYKIGYNYREQRVWPGVD